jgi:hypothetical protein
MVPAMAMIAVFDLVTGPMSWWRKAGWFLVVLSLPLVGPILYYRRGTERAPQRKRRTRSTQKGTDSRATRAALGAAMEGASALSALSRIELEAQGVSGAKRARRRIELGDP